MTKKPLWIMLLAVASCREAGPPPAARQAPEAAAPTEPEPAPAPRAAATTAPGCTMESIRATVAERMPRVTACYREAAERDPSLKGRVAIELGIGTSGMLENRSVYESALPIPVGACIVSALEGLRFAGRFEGPCIVIYPFVFSASPAPRNP